MKKIVVIKFGGHAFEELDSLENLLKNIKKLRKQNYAVVLVHGGTPKINEKLKQYNIEAPMIDGIRITSLEVVNIVEEATLGNISLKIVRELNKNEINAVGLNGSDCNLLKCEKFKSNNGVDYGMVGNIIHVNAEFLRNLLEQNIVPVIAPIGVDDLGNGYNLNSDPLAERVATALGADYLINVTNINGVREEVNDPNSRLIKVDTEITEQLIANKKLSGEMLTKIHSCLEYAKKNNRNCYIIDEKTEIDFNELEKGTVGTKVAYDSKNEVSFRLANKEDIPSIYELIQTAFPDYQKEIEYKISPLLESKDDIYNDIKNIYVFVGIRHGEIISSARLTVNGNIARIKRVCVTPELYNNGYGTKMMKYIEEYAKNLGVTHVGITTIEDNPKLKHFYEKNGYKKVYVNYNRGFGHAVMLKKLNNENDINLDWFINN